MAIFWVAILNAAAFVLAGCSLRGFAYEGRSSGNRYYLGSVSKNWRKSYETEVSREVFVYSTIHGWSVLILVPVGIAAVLVGSRRGQKNV
jgi:hypothetical protein